MGDRVDDGFQRDLQVVLDDAVARHGVPGAAVGVAAGDVSVAAATGVTNVEHPLPVDDRTLFQAGSITKTFVAALVGTLVDDGQVAWDDPVSKHLPDLAERTGLDTDAITVEHLLSHQAGFDGDRLLVAGTDDGLAGLRDAPRLFPPGAGFSYNNAAFAIVGAVIEAVTSEPFVRVMRARLLEPLALTVACFTADDAITHRVAAPHWVLPGADPVVLRRAGWQPGWGLTELDWPAGGLVVSVTELLAWCRFQWSGGVSTGGQQILQPATLARLHEPVVQQDSQVDVALDWFVETTDGVRTIEHGGLTVGYCSDLVVAPAEQVGIIVMTHATNGAIVNQEVRRWVLRRLLGIEEHDPPPRAEQPADVVRYEGVYIGPFAELTVRAAPAGAPGPLVVEFSRRGDVDGWQPPPEQPVHLAFVDGGFSTAGDDAVTLDRAGTAAVGWFGPGGNGPVEWLLWGLRRAPRVGPPPTSEGSSVG